MDAKKIGQYIATLRKETGMTQQELADKLNVTAKAVSKWETGHGLPDIQTIEPLANALHVSIPEIMKGEAILPDAPPPSVTDTMEDTAAYVAEQSRLTRKSWILAAAGILLGVLGIPFAILGIIWKGAIVTVGAIVQVMMFLPLAGALILMTTGGILLVQRYEVLRRVLKAVLLYVYYLCAVLVVFQMTSVYNFGDIPTPMVLGRLILYPTTLWGGNLLLLWYLAKRSSRE